MGNVAQLITAVRKPQFPLTFTNGSLAESGNGTLLNSGITGLDRRVMPAQGSVYMLAATYSANLTAGTIQLQPSINGTVQPFYVRNAAASAKGVYGQQAARVTNFNAGDTLQIVYNASGLNAAGIAIEVDVYVFYEDINL